MASATSASSSRSRFSYRLMAASRRRRFPSEALLEMLGHFLRSIRLPSGEVLLQTLQLRLACRHRMERARQLLLGGLLGPNP